MRKNRGGFDRQPEDPAQDIEITASGRDSWIGWLELAKEATDETSTRMTAQVIEDVDAEVIAVIEAEDRPSLLRFNRELMDDKYRHIMLIDGNDERGIDVGIMTKSGFRCRTSARTSTPRTRSGSCSLELGSRGGISLMRGIAPMLFST